MLLYLFLSKKPLKTDLLKYDINIVKLLTDFPYGSVMTDSTDSFWNFVK